MAYVAARRLSSQLSSLVLALSAAVSATPAGCVRDKAASKAEHALHTRAFVVVDVPREILSVERGWSLLDEGAGTESVRAGAVRLLQASDEPRVAASEIHLVDFDDRGISVTSFRPSDVL